MRTTTDKWAQYLDAAIIDLMNTEPDSAVGRICWKLVEDAEEYLTKVDDPARLRPFVARHVADQCASHYFG